MTMLGKKHTEETKQKIREKNKGNHYGLGYKHTDKQKFKSSISHKGQIAWNKGKKISRESILKRTETRKRNGGFIPWNKGLKGVQIGPNKGKKLSEETKKKLSLSHIGLLTKENHPNWQGGKSFKEYPMDWTKTLKRSIRERDNYICKLCGKTQIEEIEKIEKKLSVHHIDYDKKNCNPKNLITLCLSCHTKTNFNREYWLNFFVNKNGII